MARKVSSVSAMRINISYFEMITKYSPTPTLRFRGGDVILGSDKVTYYSANNP